jgi:hypothetical protein
MNSAAASNTSLASAPARMRIANIVTGSLRKPARILLYGVDGIGKTTLAANAEAPVFIGAEDGTATLDIARYPEPESWRDALDALDDLATSEHGFRTVVIDSLDWLEPRCWKHVVGTGKHTEKGAPIESIEDFGYGKGYTAAQDEWRLLCSKLDRLRDTRAMQVILIAHAWIKKFSNPQGDDFDRFQIKLNDKASAVLREWCDAVLFAVEEQYTHKARKGDRAKGISTGARIMHTERAAAFDAKNRYNLPKTLPLDWQSLRDAIEAGQPAAPDALRARIEALLEGAADELQKRVRVAVAQAADDAGKLARIANKLAATVSISDKENEQ